MCLHNLNKITQLYKANYIIHIIIFIMFQYIENEPVNQFAFRLDPLTNECQIGIVLTRRSKGHQQVGDETAFITEFALKSKSINTIIIFMILGISLV